MKILICDIELCWQKAEPETRLRKKQEKRRCRPIIIPKLGSGDGNPKRGREQEISPYYHCLDTWARQYVNNCWTLSGLGWKAKDWNRRHWPIIIMGSPLFLSFFTFVIDWWTLKSVIWKKAEARIEVKLWNRICYPIIIIGSSTDTSAGD